MFCQCKSELAIGFCKLPRSNEGLFEDPPLSGNNSTIICVLEFCYHFSSGIEMRKAEEAAHLFDIRCQCPVVETWIVSIAKKKEQRARAIAQPCFTPVGCQKAWRQSHCTVWRRLSGRGDTCR